MLVDSIIIDAARREHSSLRRFIARHGPAVSAVSYVEVMGFRHLVPEERRAFETFFLAAPILAISDAVLEAAAGLRRRRKMTLGDALVGGTALEHDLQLVTANVRDFEWIEGLEVLNPLDT